MQFFRLIGALSLAALTTTVVGISDSVPRQSPSCRAIPGDPSWPTQADWNAFNKTVNGRLIATVPIAAPCHTTLFGRPNPAFNQQRCDALRNVWFFPETHLASSSSPMGYPFSNNSCNPFTAPSSPCTIGYHVTYAVDASSASHIQSTIAFVKKYNIRLVIRNTGHDYLGRSTGAHSLAIWTHHMKETTLVKAYKSRVYSGPALRLGAGVEVREAYTFADKNGLMVVGGNCPTVGIAGGYTQGGGHGPLASKFGLAADQVLEWQVVTAAGQFVTASPTSNPDLFWALRGGGGSTYGVVVSMTVKAYRTTFASTANLQLLNTGANADALYEAVRAFLSTLPGIVDKGVMASWVAAPFGFLVSPAFAPQLHKAELDALFQPTLQKMKELNLDYTYTSAEYPSFLSAYNSIPAQWNVSDYNLGGRLIPRSLIEGDLSSFLGALRTISSQTLVSGVSFNLGKGVSNPDDVAVNPYMRKSIVNFALGTPINYTDFAANKAAQDRITNEFLPLIERITPNGGAYWNEADFQDPNYKSTYYGTHYDRLNKIKSQYDPTDVFYARNAVGSGDRWTQRPDGRLCRK